MFDLTVVVMKVWAADGAWLLHVSSDHSDPSFMNFKTNQPTNSRKIAYCCQLTEWMIEKIVEISWKKIIIWCL